MHPFVEIALSNAAVATLLAGLVIAFDRKIGNPLIRHCLWLVVVAKLVTPPWIPLSLPVPSSLASEIVAWQSPLIPVEAASRSDKLRTAGLIPQRPTRGWFDSFRNSWGLRPPNSGPLGERFLPPAQPVTGAGLHLGQWLLALWVAGSTVWFGRALILICCFHGMLRCISPGCRSLQADVNRLADSMGLKESPTVLLVPGTISPMIWSLGNTSRLLFPRDLLPRLSQESRDTLLAHELAHLCRRDHWVRGLELLATGLFWWLPTVWLARRRINAAEEECCDAWVLAHYPARRRAYADALLDTLDFVAESRACLPPAACGIGYAKSIKSRLVRIMCATTSTKLSLRARTVVLLLTLIVIPVFPRLTIASRPSHVLQNSTRIERDVQPAVATLD